MNDVWNKRSAANIKFLYRRIWPAIKLIFRIDVQGVEYLTQAPSKVLYVANHNSGALIESFSALMVLEEKDREPVFGFTHPSIFKVPLIKQYFEVVGAVPATYPVAKEVFDNNFSLMIFPGGNSQALRSVWDYRKNDFRTVHGWAKIAQENKVTVIPVTFRNTHFINPILLSGSWVSKILILPWILGLKKASVSLGQILSATLTYILLIRFGLNGYLSLFLSYITFNLTPIIPIIPVKVIMNFHTPILYRQDRTQEELEDKVQMIMANIYS